MSKTVNLQLSEKEFNQVMLCYMLGDFPHLLATTHIASVVPFRPTDKYCMLTRPEKSLQIDV
jgi:hypothetical protein